MTVLFVAIYVSLIFNVIKVRSETDKACIADQRNFDSIINSGKALDVFYFMNDTKETIQLTWAGENSGVLILVTMTEGDAGPGLTSDIYRSDNNGKFFQKITLELGEKVYIRRENGLQRHQNQRDSKELFVICYDIDNKQHSVLFVTRDGGFTWDKSNVPFLLSGQLRFYPRRRLSPWILTLEDKTSSLYLSLDNGKSWTKVHENVADFFWSIYDSDPEETFYVLHKSSKSENVSNNQLIKTIDFGKSWIPIIDNVVRVWAPRGIQSKPIVAGVNHGAKMPGVTTAEQTNRGRFLYVAHNTHADNQTMQLSISTDGGKTFKPVYLPTILPERFYSVLEVEDDLAFVHVDAPNDTGYGTLFTSDVTGRVFTESLRQHLYPNHAPVTDFYRVASMRGTYLATRLNPDRTLHTVITHDRGASWRALGAPLNTPGACKPPPPNREGQTSSTPASWTTFSRQGPGVNQTGEDGYDNNTAGPTSIQSISNETWESEHGTNDTLSVDPSAIKVCGLQVSNQFSIRNRVIASPPLSISAAPGLILVHGHVATHLKNTPADVFVSSDGGYTWLKALDGPHHYQIANRGGLIVAVPANTLWPDVLRFSTDEGRCWHTIPLRTGTWHTDAPTQPPSIPTTTAPSSDGQVTTVTVLIHESSTTAVPKNTTGTTENTTATPTALNTTLITNATTTTSAPHQLGNKQTNNTQEMPLLAESWNRARADETVVFTGLVTEPGGRAMAAAVYGYGTVSQRWRVAVVDFMTNGMVQRACNEDDYEEWVPHSSTEGAQDGCLLGLRERYRRLKKDSVCVNEYGMNPLIEAEACLCTPADFECEYGFYRQLGSLECIRNPHVPLLDPCLLSENERDTTFAMGYRKIPGDQCIGGWKPPRWNQTIVYEAGRCMRETQSSKESVGHIFSTTVAILLLFACFLAIGAAFYCHRRGRQLRSAYSINYPRSRFGALTDHVRRAVNPWTWKRSAQGGLGAAPSYSDSSSVLWPPANQSPGWPVTHSELHGSYHQENHHPYHQHSSANMSTKSNPGLTPINAAGSLGSNGTANTPHFPAPAKASSGLDALTHLTHMRPTFMSRLRPNGSDVTKLLDAEELAIPSEPHPSGEEQPDVVFRDPLSGPMGRKD